jgi:predicted P-loop ATPase
MMTDEEEAPLPPAPEIWDAWGLQVNDKGIPYLNLHNAALILEADPRYKNSVYFDDFLQRVMRRNSPEREWGDSDDLELMRHMQRDLGLPRMGREAVSQAVVDVAYRRRRNCVREWLDTLVWDNESRIEHFFSDYMGAVDSDYCKHASRNFWLSIAARIYSPGCKVDNMIVLEGPQGVGKSTALQIVGGTWFAEQHESATNPKAFAEILQGKLLIEISEMESFTHAEVNRVKQTITCRSDRFRAAYSRHAADHPRTCIFVGTTNRDDWNKDETGARRFWPIACSGDIDLEGIRANRDNLFAEARDRVMAGEDHWKMPADATAHEQRDRYSPDPWHAKVLESLKGKDETTTSQIMSDLGIDVVRQGRAEQMRVGRILRFLGWNRSRLTTGVSREYVYKSPEVGQVGQVGRKFNN